MIDVENIRKNVATGLSDYLSCKVIRGNQTAPVPPFPYCSYNITLLADENNGTYGIEDGLARKSHLMTLSFKSHSDDYAESVNLANKAREWFEYVGLIYLSDHGIDIHSTTAVTDRSNLLSIEYEYSYGFDCFIWVYDEIQAEQIGEGEISTATINESTLEKVSALERVIEAIIANGVDVPEDTDETEYGELINQACKIQYNEGYNQGFNDNSPDAVVAELEAMIDESGVLDSTDGTATEKVEQLIDLSYIAKNIWALRFKYGATLKDEIIIDCKNLKFIEYAFSGVRVKTIRLSNTQNVTNWMYAFNGCGAETIETLDFSNCESMNVQTLMCDKLKNLKIVSQTLKYNATINSRFLTTESIQNIIDGLADLTGQTARKLTLHTDVVAKLTTEQLTQISNKNWDIG